MATIAGRIFQPDSRIDVLSGTPRAQAIDRWIFVLTAAWFIVIVLTGFIPDSIMKVQLVGSGARPPFPFVMHLHAVLMGSFLLLLLTQTVLMATGRREYHMRLGVAAFAFVPALVVVGFILAPTMYYQVLEGLQSAPPAVREKLQEELLRKENILLLQMRIGILFPLFLAIGLRARRGHVGLHKRMMFLGTAVALPAAIDRMHWLPTTLPASPLASDLYTVLAVSPMLVWDVIRNQSIHRAYWIWLALFVPFSVVVNMLWDKPGWHVMARQIMGL